MLLKDKKATILKRIEFIYPNLDSKAIYKKIEELVEKYGENKAKSWVSEDDVMLITYGDSIKNDEEAPLKTLNTFLNKYCQDTLSAVHLLPMFPFTSDDGFSVVDYKEINPELGTWDDINELAQNYDLMFDAVINHISKSSEWFEGFLAGDDKYKDYFIVSDPNLDYSQVTRPRALPLLTPFETKDGKKHVWTTFSDDQIDLNFGNPQVTIEILDVLAMYAIKGSRFIRFDAIGFAWKELGTTCMHMPQTHELVKLMRDVLDVIAPGTVIITETNVPHKDNISYFGNGHDEAQMVYQFPLPPLTLFSFLTGDATKLSKWAESLEETTEDTTFFNFLASHDGIGMRPTEGILTDEEKQLMVDNVIANGGKINFRNNPDGTKSPYELNINYQDALTSPDAPESERINKLLASQTILLSMIGMPAIYVHSLLGSRNWYKGVEESGINRRINREKLDYNTLVSEIENDTARAEIFNRYSDLIKLRRQQSAFSPAAKQEVKYFDARVFSIVRKNEETNQEILVLVNVANEDVELNIDVIGNDLIARKAISENVTLKPFQTMWIELKR